MQFFLVYLTKKNVAWESSLESRKNFQEESGLRKKREGSSRRNIDRNHGWNSSTNLRKKIPEGTQKKYTDGIAG